MSQVSFLMNGIPVSDGTLPTVSQHLGKVDGTPALITDLKPMVKKVENEQTSRVIIRHGRLYLFTAEQMGVDAKPYVRFTKCDVQWHDLVEEDGHLALVGEEFADKMKGWALVLVTNNACSP